MNDKKSIVTHHSKNTDVFAQQQEQEQHKDQIKNSEHQKEKDCDNINGNNLMPKNKECIIY
ncbi:MAG: hypothetical protein WCB31_10280 [Nitrososphaeraceae archaeon]